MCSISIRCSLTQEVFRSSMYQLIDLPPTAVSKIRESAAEEIAIARQAEQS